MLVLVFEFSKGFHDTANAVATAIYTHSLKPIPAVVWSGLMNFLGVMRGGHRGGLSARRADPARRPVTAERRGRGRHAGRALRHRSRLERRDLRAVSAFSESLMRLQAGRTALDFELPNSGSHSLIGALIGIAVENALVHGRGLGNGVDWHQAWSVLASLLVSPVLGFVLSPLLFRGLKLVIQDQLCLDAGTTLGEKLRKQHLAPAQGASAELAAAALIGGAGFSGCPVSTTQVVAGASPEPWWARVPACKRRRCGRSGPRGS